MKHLTLLFVLAMLALPTVAETKSIDETRKASGNVEVQIELIGGEVRVVGWNRDEVRVQGTINDRYENFEFFGDEDGLSIEISPPRGRHHNLRLEADLEISVPSGAELSFETVSGNLRVSGLDGSVGVESVSGDITIGDGPEKLRIESITGTIELEVSSATDYVEVETVSGNVEMSGDLNRSGDYSFSSVTGNITLRVPSGASADYEIETFSGKIRNDFGPKPEKEEYLPALSLSFSVGSGDAEVSAESVNGSIYLLSK